MVTFGAHTLAHSEYQGFSVCHLQFAHKHYSQKCFLIWTFQQISKWGWKSILVLQIRENLKIRMWVFFWNLCSKRWSLQPNSALRLNPHTAVHGAMIPNGTGGKCIGARREQCPRHRGCKGGPDLFINCEGKSILYSKLQPAENIHNF